SHGSSICSSAVNRPAFRKTFSQNPRLCYQTSMDNDSNKTPKTSRGAPTGKRPPRKALGKVLEEKPHAGERIAKVMARVGLCSRRDAEIWIEQGRVAVNGEV